MTVKDFGGSNLALALIAWLSPGSGMAAADMFADGKKVALDRNKGNCLGSPMIHGELLPGNIGPPLIAMKSRFPDKGKLRAQIWDPTATNPNSIMPPFGRHRILTEKEIDLVTEYIHNL